MPAAIRILVVDDHTLFRRGLTALLSRDAGFQVVGDAADAGEAQRRARELQPDLILLDNHLPGVNGVDALPALAEAAPAAKVLMLTVSEDERDLAPFADEIVGQPDQWRGSDAATDEQHLLHALTRFEAAPQRAHHAYRITLAAPGEPVGPAPHEVE